ncbi:hypothetical protein ILYODFUR_004335 [Ilyodon furcidens]|uniref:Uncharacterized protein n=1 Tax=Ilyodon furcidens TaxID=33524 RepID=A0ABV0U6V8_9TELE
MVTLPLDLDLDLDLDLGLGLVAPCCAEGASLDHGWQLHGGRCESPNVRLHLVSPRRKNQQKLKARTGRRPDRLLEHGEEEEEEDEDGEEEEQGGARASGAAPGNEDKKNPAVISSIKSSLQGKQTFSI